MLPKKKIGPMKVNLIFEAQTNTEVFINFTTEIKPYGREKQ